MTTANPQEQTLIDELAAIYDGRAHAQYGLSLVNQRAHALQSAHHARHQQLAPALVVAALLHDIGHMVHDLGEHPAARGIDDQHEALGARWLSRCFGPSVCDPVRLHVAAKRYLCSVEPAYRDRLSRDSIESLALQGGLMSPREIAAFEAEPFWREAVALRRIDEAAKDPAGPMPAFASFTEEIVQALRSSPALQG